MQEGHRDAGPICPTHNQPLSACPVECQAGGKIAAAADTRITADQITHEMLQEMKNIEVDVHGDFSAVLNQMNTDLDLQLKPRPDGFHITAVSVTEYEALKKLPPEQVSGFVAELQALQQELQSGQGYEVKGIGFIDGATAPNLRTADQTKKVAFVALDIPRLQKVRDLLGLSTKDFHITLGFEGADIHMQITGKDEKGKDKLGPIPKKADPTLDRYTEMLPAVSFQGISGEKKERKEKQAPPPKVEKVPTRYDADQLRNGLMEWLADPSQNHGKITPERVDAIVAAATGSDSKQLGRELQADAKLIGHILKAATIKE